MPPLERPQIVRYARTRGRSVLARVPDAYAYRPELGWRWLQRAAIAILRWVGACHRERVTVWTRETRANDDLLQTLLGQDGEFLERAYARTGMRIYMGPDDQAELMQLCHHMGMMPVHLPAGIEIRGPDGPRWRDIPITVVPWMQGALIAPA